MDSRYIPSFFALLALESFFMGTQAKALSIKMDNYTVQIEQTKKLERLQGYAILTNA